MMEIIILHIYILADVIAAVLIYLYLFLSFSTWAPLLWTSICFVAATSVFVGAIMYLYLVTIALRHGAWKSWEIGLPKLHEK